MQNNQGYANSSNNIDNNAGSINSESSEVKTDEEIVLEAIKKTGATSIVDIVKIVTYIKKLR